ncbi:unnamed protein product [Musa hybrid cultivar]
MQLHKEFETDHSDHHSGESISGMPIKKRLFHLSQCSSSLSQETCTMPHNCRGQPKKFFLEEESSVSENGAALALDTNTIPKDFLKSSSTLSGQKSYFYGPNMSMFHSSAVQADHENMELKKATSTFKGSNMVEDPNIDNRSSLSLSMEKGKQLAQLGISEMVIGDRHIEGKFASSDVPAFRGVETTSNMRLTSCNDKKYHGYNSLEREKVEMCSMDLPLVKGSQHLNPTMHNDLDPKYGSAHHCVNRVNWDLNVPMEVWDASINDSIIEHNINNRLNKRAMHQQNIDRCLFQTTLGTIGSDLTLGTSMVEKNHCSPRLTDLGMPADDDREYEGGLELQLRPPSRPELRIKWGKIVPPDLSLSLTGNLSDASCRVVKPEPCEDNSHKETENFQLSSLKPVGISLVKSEPCDESSQGEASSVAVPFDQEPSVGRMRKSEAPQELEGKSSNLELESHLLTSCCTTTDIPLSKVKAVVLNSNVVLHDGSPVIPDNLKIKSGESTCLALDCTTVSGASIPCKAEVMLTDTCTHHDSQKSTVKPLDMVVDSVISDANGFITNETEISETAEVASTLHHESLVSDLEEPMACDGMSEGSAEMDFSGGEYYTSPKVVARDDLHVSDKSGVSSGGDQDSMDLPAEIQTEQPNDDDLQLDASNCLTCSRDEISRSEGGDLEDKGADLRDPVPQCANEVSCDHDEKRVHGYMSHCANEVPCKNVKEVQGDVATALFSSNSVPIMVEVHLDKKGKQIVSQEARSGHSAKDIDGNMKDDKKQTSCDLTTDVHELSVTRVLRASSSKRLTKPCHGVIEMRLGKDKVSEMKSNSFDAIAKTNRDNLGKWQISGKYASASIKHPELPERDFDVSGIVNKHVDDAGSHNHIKNADASCKNRQIEKVSSPTIKSFGQRRPISAWTVPSGTEERVIIKQRQDRLYSEGRRPSKVESRKNQGQRIDECDSNYRSTRRHGNQYFDRDSDTQYAPELNNPGKHHLPKLSKRLEIPFGSVGNAGRLLRKPINDQPNNSSRFPSWRQLPGHQEVPSLLGARSAGFPAKNTTSNRFIGRKIHDDTLLAHEDNMIGNLPGEMVDNVLYSRPNLQYEPTENDLMTRGRSLSPLRRRLHPVQYYRAHSPRMWPSPGRSPEMVVDRHQELIRHGPSPVVRVGMSRSPHPQPCFPEDGIVRRNVSPPYPQFPADMRDMLPVDDLNFHRPGGVLQRNLRRFDMMPHDTVEDYLGPPDFVDHFDRRDYYDRHERVQPLYPGCDPGDIGKDALPYDDGCHMPNRFFPVGEVIPARGSSRDFVSHIRNRLGNATNIFRTQEQDEDYRYHRKQGWHEGGFNDMRPKRRKF